MCLSFVSGEYPSNREVGFVAFAFQIEGVFDFDQHPVEEGQDEVSTRAVLCLSVQLAWLAKQREEAGCLLCAVGQALFRSL